MRTFLQVASTLGPVPSFADENVREQWTRRWCDACAHYSTCPILAAVLAFAGRTPTEWIRPAGGDLECQEFEPATGAGQPNNRDQSSDQTSP